MHPHDYVGNITYVHYVALCSGTRYAIVEAGTILPRIFSDAAAAFCTTGFEFLCNFSVILEPYTPPDEIRLFYDGELLLQLLDALQLGLVLILGQSIVGPGRETVDDTAGVDVIV